MDSQTTDLVAAYSALGWLGFRCRLPKEELVEKKPQLTIGMIPLDMIFEDKRHYAVTYFVEAS